MSRMADPDLWVEPPGTYAENIAAGLAKLGISLDGGKVTSAPPEPPVDQVRKAARDAAWLAEREGFFQPEGNWEISPTLAKLMHYNPRIIPRDVPGDDVDAELRSIDEASRNGR